MNEMKENQSDAHPTQINRVATRSSSKMSFIFRGSWGSYELYRSLSSFSLGYLQVIVISERCLSKFRKVTTKVYERFEGVSSFRGA